MDLLSRLESLFESTDNALIREASDAIALERLLSDKLYRALKMSESGDHSVPNQSIIDEAMFFYELSRLKEI